MTSPSPTRHPAGVETATRHVDQPVDDLDARRHGRQRRGRHPRPAGTPDRATRRDPARNLRRRVGAAEVGLVVMAVLLFSGMAAGAYAAASLVGVVILLSGALLGGATALTGAAWRLGGRGWGPPALVITGPDGPVELPHEPPGTDLGLLAQLGHTLPAAQDLDELLAIVRDLLVTRFEASRVALFTVDDDRWHPELVEGLAVDTTGVLRELPPPLDQARLAPTVVRVDDLAEVSDRSGSGLYARLVVEGLDEGLLAIEHPEPGHFDDRTLELFQQVSELVALGVSNAESFGRLRSVAAAEERARIARDLHDRLGQWLTYISLELERINTANRPPDPQLDRLQGDVRSAIDELRDALVELRTKVQIDRPLAVVLPEVVERFRRRTGLQVSLSLPDPSAEPLSGVVENELLRIVQESLTNIEKHADATSVHISWSVEGGRGVLTIEDDGRGFDPARGIRSTAYGLVGMRERAAAVGAIVQIASQRGAGTVVTVLTGTTQEGRP